MNIRLAITGLVAVLALGCGQPTTATLVPEPPTAVLGPNEVAKSDRFWAATAFFGPTNFDYASLVEMTADAHLVVLGRVVGIVLAGPLPVDDPGGEQVRPQRFGVVAIDEVLKGKPIVRDPGQVLVVRLVSTDQSKADLPREQFVIFLKNYQQIRYEFGKGLFGDASDRFYYGLPNGYQAVLRNVNGMVKLVEGPEGWLTPQGAFPAPLAAKPFDEVLDAIRAAGAE